MIAGYIVPHPPVVVPNVGRGEEKKIQKTLDSYRRIALRIAKFAPDTVVVVSPHSVYLKDAFYIAGSKGAFGDLSQFLAPDVAVTIKHDLEMADELAALCGEDGIETVYTEEYADELDHGTVIPLWFLQEVYADFKVLRVSPSCMDNDVLYRMGGLIERAAAHVGRKIAFIASGDLSHKLKEDGPYGFAAEGPLFDKTVTEAMKSTDLTTFMKMDKELADKAAQCGLPGFIMLSGALENYDIDYDFYSYEGTFGVGYAFCEYNCVSKCARVARMSLESYIRDKKKLRDDSNLPFWMKDTAAGVFVCIKKEGQLRGCIGTIRACYSDICTEISELAVSAATNDPRFDAVRKDELDKLHYTVDIMGEAEPATIDMLDVKKYGVIVTSGSKRGLLLPNLEGVDTIEDQIFITMQKAGIEPGEPIAIERFLVERYD